MSGREIVKIEVIQNFWLWRVYQIERDRLRDKLLREPETLLLWHGTRATPPATIYEGQEGFDKRFASEYGMWGSACYFAVKASYSHNYAHVDNKTYQLFLAEVLIGDCATRPSGKYE